MIGRDFFVLCEKLGLVVPPRTIKQTKIMRYPKQIRLSETFRQALKREINRMSREEGLPNFDEKFLKALRFELFESKKRHTQLDTIKSIRKPMPPPTKVFKGKEYNRKDKSWKKQV